MCHLATKTSEHACTCLTYGFSGVESHKNPCVDCTRRYHVISRLTELMYDVEKADTTVRCSKAEEHRLEDDPQHLHECKRHLDVYHSHLAHHKAERDFDSKDIATLANHVAVIISDFKMKILLCMLRENQNWFFGKKGTACLGFAIITSSLSDSTMKEQRYICLHGFG